MSAAFNLAFVEDQTERTVQLHEDAVKAYQHYQAMGRNDEATDLLSRALPIFEATLSNDHPHLVACRENRGGQ